MASWSSRKGSKVKSSMEPKPIGGTGGNYLLKVLELAPLFGPGFHMVDVAHDDWCACYKGNPCNCEPDVEVTHSETNETGSIHMGCRRVRK